MPYSSVEIKEWHLEFPNQQDMYNSVYLRGWRKSSSPRILNLLLLQSKHIIFFEINGKIKIKSASVLLWISFRSRLSNYIHTINGRRFKIVTFHLISLSCSPPTTTTTTHARTCTHMPRCDEQASSMIVAQKTWFIQQTWSFYSFCSSLFIGNAPETLKVAAFVGLRRAAFNFTLPARHHGLFPPGSHCECVCTQRYSFLSLPKMAQLVLLRGEDDRGGFVICCLS